ncbi:hypothetical protein CWI84_04945 [Idiomarina tyrosinivorans]|uniref:Uncharacterized protein n=1 Tax=Idiomarina tyrosinivorans TaxID=1445662 RepID=A0A432ZRD0_9GAMM|nr:hypothetical protein [Idiomarina tyrosinivorans]RUO80412.1 hypothetical protein CWI84_04945 [Idiomarina tyrosinivorans]
MLLTLSVSVCSGAFLYTQALKRAMGAKRWACMGLIVGPLAWPLMVSQFRLRWLKAKGPDLVTVGA